MHKCSKCGHAATSLEEIDAGCPCGSKVFIFGKDNGEAQPGQDAGETVIAQQEGDGGKVPQSYYARTSFTDDDIENIKVLTQGVFLLDVKAISKNPVVLKDEDEIYYVKLPIVQKKLPPSGGNGNGKK
ncbi:MAG: Zn-ribbon containing protein [Candidatus Micrarchaeia archaeon]|jgi:predicted  nucleic acid-binding Zn-ribbon protein